MSGNGYGFISGRSWGAIRRGMGITVASMPDGSTMILLVNPKTAEVLNEVRVAHPVHSVAEAFRIAQGARWGEFLEGC